MERQRTEVCSVLAFVLGLMSLVVVPLFLGIAAVILGVVGTVRIQERRRFLGLGFAVAGIVFGSLSMAFAAYQLHEAQQRIERAVAPLLSNGTAAASDLQLTEHYGGPEGDGTFLIVGSIHNRSTRPYASVSVEFTLHDSDGAQVGTALDVTSNLQPASWWKFRAQGAEPRASTYKLAKITGF